MSGWFRKRLKSKTSLSTERDTEAKVTSVSPSLSPPSLETKLQKLPSALSSQTRWRRKYDLLVCHSVADSEEASRLVSFLEASPCSLRCFLWQRDVCPGSAVPTEFCQVIQESHLQALLITPNFLQEAWCMYMMHQALAEGPRSNRLIPMILNLSCNEYPQELRFYFYTDLSRNTGQAYSLINKTVLIYLEDQVKHEKMQDCSRISGEGREDEHIANMTPPRLQLC